MCACEHTHQCAHQSIQDTAMIFSIMRVLDFSVCYSLQLCVNMPKVSWESRRWIVAMHPIKDILSRRKYIPVKFLYTKDSLEILSTWCNSGSSVSLLH